MNTKSITRYLAGAATAAALMAGPALAEQINLRALGLVSTHKSHTALEKSFYESLGEKTGLDINVNFNPLDVLGVNMQDTMRVVRAGTFDIVETTIGSASRDDPFLEGLDLIGVSPDIDTLREVVDAYREPFSKRVEEKFNAKVLTLWPFGPQIFYCKGDVSGIEDMEGLRIRSYTPTMSALVESFGATPVTLQFAEVYPALQRGVAECAITSPTSGNTGNWPEVTDSLVMLSISWSVQTHLMNLDTWNGLSEEAQTELMEAFSDLEEQYWEMARVNNGKAVACSTGQECDEYLPFDMTEVTPSEADLKQLNASVEKVILPTWAETCNANYADCSKIWNETIGEVRGLRIE
ncbi:TRAP transporter substrate-binding protein [Marivita sp. GX14005]|uniref:TRAP transporter substrate-binding protein n=1 Tax=Marivita sp. GX14005 TaxID=2942276 RepID=UPI0020184153|nr:TRAP transporter substrate-binding protein [Marivita sp. GX14005]MCL3883111.1 TRAP transporter substrate-binding protein [Marivita sp. GX14005]